MPIATAAVAGSVGWSHPAKLYPQPAASAAVHPVLAALQKSLEYVSAHQSSQLPRSLLSGSQTARPSGGPPRRQTSATMRRKLAALDAMHATPAQAAAYAAARVDDSPTATATHFTLPPSILPASAREYARPPVTNFIATLPTTASAGSQRQWETLIFPSANPAVDDGNGGGGEGEVKRLASWFDDAWAQLEVKAQTQALKEKRAQAIEEKVGGGGADGPSSLHATGVDPNSPSAMASTALSPAALHALDLSREKLCFMVFHELLRHVTGASRRRGALLEKVWMAHQRLTEHRISHRISEVIGLSESNSHQALQRLTARFEELLRGEKAQLMKTGVDMTYLQAELEAKERIIANLHEENDKDLLYSNQIVCHKVRRRRERTCVSSVLLSVFTPADVLLSLSGVPFSLLCCSLENRRWPS